VTLQHAPETHTFFGTRSACRIPIRFRGIGRDRVTTVETPSKGSSEIQRFSESVSQCGFRASIEVTGARANSGCPAAVVAHSRSAFSGTWHDLMPGWLGAQRAWLTSHHAASAIL